MKKRWIIILSLIIIIGILIPENSILPVKGADSNSYNKKSFWYYPWGKSGTHKGVDIFARHDTPVTAATSGIVLFSGKIETGGNVLLVLGPKWKLHYYAHLNKIESSLFQFIKRKEIIGTVGTTGNAQGKQPHLHYSIITLIPYFWRADTEKQGWKKIFYLNPITSFNSR